MKELALYILDLAQNSVRAGAKNVEIEIEENPQEDLLTVYVKDDGCGMKKEFLEKVISPFVTTRKERRVGLGIPLFKELTEECEGTFEIFSEEGKGTRIKGTFKLSSVNLIPIGDIASTIVSLIMSAPQIDIVYRFKKGSREFEFDTKKIREVLKDVNLNDVRVLSWIREYVEEGMKKSEMEV